MKLIRSHFYFIKVCALSLALISSLCSCSQEKQTAEKVIDRYIEVSGGKQFLASIKATSSLAKGISNGDSITMYMIKECPDKIYVRYQTSAGVLKVFIMMENQY